jgi:hypothetical protein
VSDWYVAADVALPSQAITKAGFDLVHSLLGPARQA